MPRLLKDLQINDVSSVDRGAGEGVRVLLMKRDNTINVKTSAVDAKSLAEAIKSDSNVIDMTGMLRKDAVDFDTAQEVQESREAANGLMDELNEAICALSCAVNSIMCDEEVADKAEAVAESFDQFKTHLEGLAPEGMEKIMTPDQIKKQIDDAIAAVAKPLSDKIAKLEAENIVLKMTDEHADFHSKLDGDEKKKFGAMGHDERDEYMDKHPIADAKGEGEGEQDEKDEGKPPKKQKEKAVEKAIALPADVVKRLAQADANDKLLKQLVDKDEAATFSKRAVAIGLKEDQGELLRKAHKGDSEALKQVETLIQTMNKALNEARRAGNVFKEFGNSQGGSGATAMDQIKSKAEDLRKTDAGKDLTPEQAFSKVFQDPANRDLAAQEKKERNQAIGVAA